jgi:hypothetical protein
MFQKGYEHLRTDSIKEKGEGEGRMENEQYNWFNQVICDHSSQEQYSQRRFDILRGFELVETRCFNCHKILSTKITKLQTAKPAT